MKTINMTFPVFIDDNDTTTEEVLKTFMIRGSKHCKEHGTAVLLAFDTTKTDGLDIGCMVSLLDDTHVYFMKELEKVRATDLVAKEKLM